MTKVKTKDGKEHLVSDRLAERLVETGDVTIIKDRCKICGFIGCKGALSCPGAY